MLWNENTDFPFDSWKYNFFSSIMHAIYTFPGVNFFYYKPIKYAMHLKLVIKRKQCKCLKNVGKDEIGQYRNTGQCGKMKYWSMQSNCLLGGKQDVMLCFHKQNVQNCYCLVVKKLMKLNINSKKKK